MTDPTLDVIPYGPGWLSVCSVHGAHGPIWLDRRLAGWDAVGHGTAYHSSPTDGFPRVTLYPDTAARPWPVDVVDEWPEIMGRIQDGIRQYLRARDILTDWTLCRFFWANPGRLFQLLASRP